MEQIIIHKHKAVIAYETYQHNGTGYFAEAFAFTHREKQYHKRRYQRNYAAYKPFHSKRYALISRAKRAYAAYKQDIGNVAAYYVARCYTYVALFGG